MNAWPIMGLPLILSLILPINYTREMPLLPEMLPPGRALAILHLLLEPCWQTLTGEDIGQLLLSPPFTLSYVFVDIGISLSFFFFFSFCLIFCVDVLKLVEVQIIVNLGIYTFLIKCILHCLFS